MLQGDAIFKFIFPYQQPLMTNDIKACFMIGIIENNVFLIENQFQFFKGQEKKKELNFEKHF